MIKTYIYVRSGPLMKIRAKVLMQTSIQMLVIWLTNFHNTVINNTTSNLLTTSNVHIPLTHSCWITSTPFRTIYVQGNEYMYTSHKAILHTTNVVQLLIMSTDGNRLLCYVIMEIYTDPISICYIWLKAGLVLRHSTVPVTTYLIKNVAQFMIIFLANEGHRALYESIFGEFTDESSAFKGSKLWK